MGDRSTTLAEALAEVERLREESARHYRWAYAAVVALAMDELEAANSEALPGEWPLGQDWSGLGGTSRSTFMRRARDRVGIDHDAFLAPLRSGAVDVDDLFDGEHVREAPRA